MTLKQEIRRLPQSWRDILVPLLIDSDEGRVILNNLQNLLNRDRGKYHPKGKKIFAAFHATPFDKVRVVIIGQDPYPSKYKATGLAFSKPKWCSLKQEDSVKMIYRAIIADSGIPMPKHGNLNHWTKQGVLLLNRTLTLHEPENNQAKQDWTPFTEVVLKALSDSEQPIHFMLWGDDAQEPEITNNIDDSDESNKYIYTECHPMARLGREYDFRNCDHFSRVNEALGGEAIDWIPKRGSFFSGLFNCK